MTKIELLENVIFKKKCLPICVTLCTDVSLVVQAIIFLKKRNEKNKRARHGWVTVVGGELETLYIDGNWIYIK